MCESSICVEERDKLNTMKNQWNMAKVVKSQTCLYIPLWATCIASVRRTMRSDAHRWPVRRTFETCSTWSAFIPRAFRWYQVFWFSMIYRVSPNLCLQVTICIGTVVHARVCVTIAKIRWIEILYLSAVPRQRFRSSMMRTCCFRGLGLRKAMSVLEVFGTWWAHSRTKVRHFMSRRYRQR